MSLFDYIKERKEGKLRDDKDYVVERLNGLKLDQICFMDMRAAKELKSEDRNEFRAFIYGGILGDDPPQDRAAHLRNLFDANVRQLSLWGERVVVVLCLCWAVGSPRLLAREARPAAW